MFGQGQHDQFCDACLTHQYQSFSNGLAIGDGSRGVWFGGWPGNTLYTHSLPPNNESCQNGSSIPQGIYTLGSNHSGGAQATFADGHVEFVSSSIERDVWRALGTRAGNEAQ